MITSHVMCTFLISVAVCVAVGVAVGAAVGVAVEWYCKSLHRCGFDLRLRLRLRLVAVAVAVAVDFFDRNSGSVFILEKS